MAIIYTDTTNKYDVSTSGISGASKGVAQNISDAFSGLFGGIGNVIKSVLPFGEIFGLKNERLKDEQSSNLTADQIQTKADTQTIIAVVVVVIIISVVFVLIKRKKS